MQGKTACPLYPKSGHVRCKVECPLWANSGHWLAPRCQKRTALNAHSSGGTYHCWWRPRATKDGRFRPLGAHEQREVGALWCRQPVCALRFGRRIALHVEYQRPVRVVLQRLVLCAKRVALEIVRRKEVMLVV